MECYVVWASIQTQSHLKECAHKASPCAFADVGCTAMVSPQTKETHEKEAMSAHLAAVCKAYDKLAGV